MKLDKILVPTDFYREANNALEVAASISKKSGASITLLNVIDLNKVNQFKNLDIIKENDYGDKYRAVVERILQIRNFQIKKIREKYDNIRIELIVEQGIFEDYLFQYLKENNIDLIIMGTQGKTKIEDFWVGPKTQKVIQLTNPPVITVKSRIENFNAENIVFASDFINVPIKVTNALRKFQLLFDAKIHFVTITTPNNFEITTNVLNRINHFAESNGFTNYSSNNFNFYSEEEGIRVFSDSVYADLMVLITHARTGFSKLISGSITEEVLENSLNPILTFNENMK